MRIRCKRKAWGGDGGLLYDGDSVNARYLVANKGNEVLPDVVAKFANASEFFDVPAAPVEAAPEPEPEKPKRGRPAKDS